MVAVAYTDASHCYRSKIAACGFVVIADGRMIKHTVTMMGGVETSSRSEVHAVIQALQYCFLLDGVTSIQINTDHEPLVKMANKKRERYKELAETLEIINDYGIGATINYVRGHSKNKYNNMVDISARTQLRKYLRTKR